MNEAIEQAHRSGILTATSLMVASPGAADAVERARRMPDLRVGLHLVLVEATPALPPEQIPDLVDERGSFRTDMAGLGLLISLSPRVQKQVTAEIAAQFEMYAATGLSLDHVNAHRHFHLHPYIASEMIRIGQRHGLRAMRVPYEPPLKTQAEPGRGLASLIVVPWTMRMRAKSKRAGLVVPDAVFGLRWSGAMTAERVRHLIEALPPEGVFEIYAHPATENAFPGSAPGYRYRDELAALTDPAVIAAAERSGFKRGGFSDV